MNIGQLRPSTACTSRVSSATPPMLPPIALAILGALLAGCAARPSPPTVIPSSPSPTEPTAVPSPRPTLSPTETLSPTLPPEPQLGPEQPALVVEQIAGIWDVSHTYRSIRHEAALTFEPDGSYNTRFAGQDVDAGLGIDFGTYSFQQDLLTLKSDYCATPQGDIYTCTATYHVFFAMADDEPGMLRFVLVEDPDTERARYLTSKPHLPYHED